MPVILTSRERVQHAFNHVEPDHVPVQYLDNPSVGLRLKEHFELASDDDDGLLERLGVDFRGCLSIDFGGRSTSS